MSIVLESMSPAFIGITGRAGAGKDTIADMLESEIYQQTHISSDITSLATPLKAATCALFNIAATYTHDRELKESVIPAHGLSPRQMLQRMGGGLRQAFGEDLFTKLADASIARNLYGSQVHIIPDIRYQDEAEWILAKPNSILIAVSRAGDVDGTTSAHPSEDGIDFMDLKCPERIYHLGNNQGFNELRILVHRLVTKLYPQ